MARRIAEKKAKPLVEDPAVHVVAERVLEMVYNGCKIGLGTGRAAAAFIRALGGRVKDGLRVEGVPTSEASARLARELGIPLIELREDVILDITVDGADEVSPNLDLVKGRGGALVRERIVASSSKQQVILVGEEKLVPGLGATGPIPIEVIPLAMGCVTRKLKTLKVMPVLRLKSDGQVFVTDNGNWTLDFSVAGPLDSPGARRLEAELLAQPGVVDTGLFLGTARQVLVGFRDGSVKTLRR